MEIKLFDLDESMIRAIARQAEAERSSCAKEIYTLGEQKASEQLLKTAQTLSQQPQAIQLRYMQTLTEIASQHSHTIVFPLLVDLFNNLNIKPSRGNGKA